MRFEEREQQIRREAARHGGEDCSCPSCFLLRLLDEARDTTNRLHMARTEELGRHARAVKAERECIDKARAACAGLGHLATSVLAALDADQAVHDPYARSADA